MSKADIERIVAQGESQTMDFERSTGQLTRASGSDEGGEEDK
jgi:hypothetical protein